MLPVAEAVVGELAVERMIVATELERLGTVTMEKIRGLVPGVPVDAVSHDDLKRMSRGAVAVVRTGECSPYANVVLTAGVTF
jgi:D-ribose pyranase